MAHGLGSLQVLCVWNAKQSLVLACTARGAKARDGVPLMPCRSVQKRLAAVLRRVALPAAPAWRHEARGGWIPCAPYGYLGALGPFSSRNSLPWPSMDSRHGADLVSAAQHLADQCRDAVRSGPGLSDTAGIRAALDCVQSLLFQLEPTAFVQRLADQVRPPPLSSSLASRPSPRAPRAPRASSYAPPEVGAYLL